ncbi:MAG: pyridoxamine 5'-phosphate oxidase family protein [Candidatus Rokubacteria bacterium]|nr:pyridoxamine 5'-phosphate oxidase family protein [Candidatus Rokubacteria bacterium]
MPSRRDAIKMTDAELHRFLQEEKIVTIATIGPNGRPHLMPLWYVADGAVISAWTFGKSQKVKNLERTPQATLQVEAGQTDYSALRGAMLECDVELIRDTAAVEKIGAAIAARYAGAPVGEVPDFVRAQAPKRVGLVFRPTRVASWDHRKLGGGY